MLGYLGCLVLGWFLYQPQTGATNKNLVYAAVAVAGVVALLALILLIRFMRAGGIGLYVNLITAGVVVAGAVLKAKAEKVF